MREKKAMRSTSWAMTSRRNYLARILHWLAAHGRSWRSHPSRQLHLRETLALGERRFIAVVEFERQKFLIAGTGSSVAMLTALPSPETSPQNAEGARPAGQGEERHKKKEAHSTAHEEVPTWEFSTLESARQLIRR
jgi:flagellar biogenesis protein FliO